MYFYVITRKEIFERLMSLVSKHVLLEFIHQKLIDKVILTAHVVESLSKLSHWSHFCCVLTFKFAACQPFLTFPSQLEDKPE